MCLEMLFYTFINARFFDVTLFQHKTQKYLLSFLSVGAAKKTHGLLVDRRDSEYPSVYLDKFLVFS